MWLICPAEMLTPWSANNSLIFGSVIPPKLGCVYVANHLLIGVKPRATSSPSATAHSRTRCGARPCSSLLGLTLPLRLVAQSIEVPVRLAARTFAATAD
jgi:hypothetical protein